MSEFYDQPTIQPTGSDELILIRDRSPKRATVADLKTQIIFSETPPLDGRLWGQLRADNGELIELWQKRGSHWLSVAVWSIAAFEFEVKKNWAWPMPNPCPGSSVWVEDLTARAFAQDEIDDGDYIDFELKTINRQQQQVPLFYLRMEDIDEDNIFNASESVEQIVSTEDALGLWLSITRQGNRKIKTASIAATLRKVYATST